jgi:hypothetical protein
MHSEFIMIHIVASSCQFIFLYLCLSCLHVLLPTQFMLHVLDVRDAMDSERFQQLQFDPVNDPKKLAGGSNPNSSGQLAAEESKGENGKFFILGGAAVCYLYLFLYFLYSFLCFPFFIYLCFARVFVAAALSIASTPAPTLSPAMWMDSDASTFRVRGQGYIASKVKTSSAPCVFKLLCLDLFETPEAHHNICANPKNRVALAHQRGDDSWIFCLNIMVPGTPYLNFVQYFLGDRVRGVLCCYFRCLLMVVVVVLVVIDVLRFTWFVAATFVDLCFFFFHGQLRLISSISLNVFRAGCYRGGHALRQDRSAVLQRKRR